MDAASTQSPVPTAFSYTRISSGQQRAGGGLERQSDMAAAWCTAHGYSLDSTLDLTDSGRSAFKGKHLSHGALGRFLQLAQQGALGADPVLLIEAVDRLSRQEPMAALQKVAFALVDAGVTIVDLEDQRTYNRESLQGDGLIWLVLKAKAAHEYSSRLSRRVVAHWDQHRDALRSGTATHRGKGGGRKPFWLDLDPATQQWKLNDRAADVALIFQELEHHGLSLVAQTLNLQGSRSPGGKPWAHYSVRKVATDPAAMGTLRLGIFAHDNARAAHYRWTQAKAQAVADGLPFNQPEPHIPDVELIPDHYPAVVDQETFNHIATRLQQRHHSPAAAGNRRHKALHSFLQGLVVCQHDGTMGATLSRKPGRDHYYLRCRSRSRSGGKGCQCNGRGWRVDEVQPMVVARLSRHILGTALLPGHDHEQQLDTLKAQLKVAQQQLRSAADALATATTTLEQAVDRGAQLDLLENLSQLVEKRRAAPRKAQALVEQLNTEITTLKARAQPADQLGTIAIHQLLTAVANDTATRQERSQLHRALQQAQLQVQLDDSNPDHLRVGMRFGNEAEYSWQRWAPDLARIALDLGGTDLKVGAHGTASFEAPDEGHEPEH
jgi:DNA invertase Pin-like site-specific DNA recombinase